MRGTRSSRNSDRHAGDLRLEDELAVHHALRLRDEATRARVDLLAEDHEGVSRDDLAAEARFVAAQEAEEAVAESAVDGHCVDEDLQ